MPENVAKKLAFKLQTEINNERVWEELDPEFKSRVANILSQVLDTDNPPRELLESLSYQKEGKVTASFCFFDGKIRKLLTGEKFSNPFMRGLMIESSGRMQNWLEMRKFLNRKRPYSLVVNAYSSDLLSRSFNYPEVKEEVPPWQPKQTPFTQPIKGTLDYKLESADEGFRISMFTLMDTAINMGVPFSVFGIIPPRREANVITARSFRNTSLEDIHAEETSASEETFAQLVNETGNRLGNWLLMIDQLKNSPTYKGIVSAYWHMYCSEWLE